MTTLPRLFIPIYCPRGAKSLLIAQKVLVIAGKNTWHVYEPRLVVPDRETPWWKLIRKYVYVRTEMLVGSKIEVVEEVLDYGICDTCWRGECECQDIEEYA